jgi:hypothetical protein
MLATKYVYDVRRNSEQGYALEITSDNIVDLDECLSYKAYGLRLTLNDSGEPVLDIKNIALTRTELESRVAAIVRNNVPYYQIKDIIDDYLLI